MYVSILSEVKEIVYLEILSMEFTFYIYENIEDLYALGTCLMLWLMFLLIELMQEPLVTILYFGYMGTLFLGDTWVCL